MRKVNSIFILCLIIPLFGMSQQEESTKEIVEKTRQLLSEIGLISNSISIHRDSTRFNWQKGTYYDLFFKDKKLWNLKKYNKNGDRIDSSNFQDGYGFIYVKNNQFAHYVEVKNGLLNGQTKRFVRYSLSNYQLTYSCQYKNGLKDGECNRRSSYDKSVIAQKSYYTNGVLTKLQSFGIRKFKLAFNWALFKPVITQSDKICQESIYKDGQLISTTCLIKNCNTCGY